MRNRSQFRNYRIDWKIFSGLTLIVCSLQVYASTSLYALGIGSKSVFIQIFSFAIAAFGVVLASLKND